jgi:hypothetical protein
LRWETLSVEDRAYCEARGASHVEALRERGIGGYATDDQVKCLHVHYAHFLATGDNIVGEWVQELLDADAACDESSSDEDETSADDDDDDDE